MKKLILLSIILFYSCDLLTEPEDCASVAGGDAVIDECGICDGYDCNGECDENVELWGECYNIEKTTVLDLSDSGLTGEIPLKLET